MRNLGLILLVILLGGCLQSRQAIKENVVIAPENRAKAQAQADSENNEEQIRALRGQVESLERGLQEAQAARQQAEVEKAATKLETEEKLKVYADTISRLEAQYLSLAQKLETLTAEKAAKAAPAPQKSGNAFDAAEALFNQKKWREAIVEYQNYRDKNPKGNSYSEATYKMGVAFQELGMKDEAKAFYSEVVQKFAKSKSAEKAKYRLKNLK